MAEIVTMPKLGFDMAEGTLVRWVIAESQPVVKGAVLAEIETDKATVEVESAFEGVVKRHLVEKGAIVPVGTPIAIIGAVDEVVDGSMSVQTVVISTKAGAEASIPVTPTASVVQEKVGSDEVDTQLPDGVRATPVARRLAAEKGLDLKSVKGTGPLGRIIKKDVEAYIEKLVAIPAEVTTPVPTISPAAPVEKKAAAPLPVFTPVGPAPADEYTQISRLRAAIGRRMVEAKQQVPHFYVTHEYDVASLLELRKRVNALLPDEQKISVNDFIVKAVALALRQFPNLNSSLDGERILHHGQVNVGVAVAVEGGLLTVVCQDTDRKPLRQIATEVRSMVARAREGKVRPDDIEGSTFSVSNLGMFDVESFIAIINPPEAAILAVGSAREVPVVEDGEIKPGLRMRATISVDHRVSDGVEAAQFLKALAGYVEEPLSLLV